MADQGKAYAVAVVVNEHGEVLLLERSRAATLGPGKWGLPGGKLNAGEAADTAMERELGEELGGGTRLQCVGELGPLPAAGLPGSVIHLFRYRWLGGEIRLDAEHTRFAWVAPSALESLDVMDGVRADLVYFGLLDG